MNLEEILKNLDSLNDESAIFAEENSKWSKDSKALVSDSDEVKTQNFQYLLKADLAKEAIKIWSKWRDGRRPAIENICEAVIYYAENDAYLPVKIR